MSFKHAVINNHIVVDKSMVIEELLINVQVSVMLIYPHLWGKTFILGLIEAFFEIEHDENGIELPADEKLNKLLFQWGAVGTNACGKPMVIFQRDEFDKHFGRYPVVHLSLQGTGGKSYGEIVERLVGKIKELYVKFRFLKTSGQFRNDDELSRYDDILLKLKNHVDLNQPIEERVIEKSLATLIDLVHGHFESKVVLLVDAFDSPLDYGFENSTQLDDLKRASDLIKGKHLF
jgi:hypothetical protein